MTVHRDFLEFGDHSFCRSCNKTFFLNQMNISDYFIITFISFDRISPVEYFSLVPLSQLFWRLRYTFSSKPYYHIWWYHHYLPGYLESNKYTQVYFEWKVNIESCKARTFEKDLKEENMITQPAITCSKLTIKTLEQDVKYVQN